MIINGDLRIGSLFSGYGGLDEGVMSALGGGEVMWHVEFAEAPSRILAHHFPAIPNYGDVTSVDWASVPPIDVLTGGFPCTDVSSSGNKKGVADGEFSGLWREYATAIRNLRPKLVVVENVRDLLVRGLDIVLGDLAELGYDARWVSLPACAAGAPFARVRMFLIGAPTSTGFRGFEGRPQLNGHPKETVPIREGWIGQHADRLALASVRALDRWASILGRHAPSPVGRKGSNSQPFLSPAFEEWLMGLEPGRVTDPNIGISDNEQLKALGNGVVPQQAALAVAWLLNQEMAA